MKSRLAICCCAALVCAAGAVHAGPVEPGGDAAANPMAERDGAALYEKDCGACHGAGPGHPGTTALALKYHRRLPAVLSERGDLSAAAVEYFIRNGVNAMPFFRKTEISDAEMTAIASYLAKKPVATVK